MALSIARQEYAAEIFLAEMRRQFFLDNPAALDCPVKSLASYPPTQRRMLMKAMSTVVASLDPINEPSFQKWVAGKTKGDQP